MSTALAVNSWLGLFLVFAGPFVGSFISASAQGWPERTNLLAGRSRCTACGHALGLSELVPLASFVFQKGRCTACGAPIARQHLIAELASLLIAVASVLVFSRWIMLASALLGWGLLFIALVDARTRLIPDGAVFALAGGGWLVAFVVKGGAGLLVAVAGAALGYSGFWLVAWIYRRLRGRDGLGLGDAKLLAVGGAWGGALALSWIVLIAASTALAFLLMAGRGKIRAKTVLPFGPALAFGIYAMWLWTGIYDFR